MEMQSRVDTSSIVLIKINERIKQDYLLQRKLIDEINDIYGSMQHCNKNSKYYKTLKSQHDILERRIQELNISMSSYYTAHCIITEMFDID